MTTNTAALWFFLLNPAVWELSHRESVLGGMSPVGHSLVGLALARVAARKKRLLATSVAFVLLANLPDWPLPGWGHDAYHVSHSLPVNLALILPAAAILRGRLPGRLIALGAAAWLSHLLLDSFYNHAKGIEIGWPLTSYRLNLPIPWLRTMDLTQPPWSGRNLSVFALEAATFGPLWLIVNRIRKR